MSKWERNLARAELADERKEASAMTAKPEIFERTSAPPRTIDGMTFRCYRVGIMKNEWHADSDRSISIGSTLSLASHWASVDGRVIGNSYRDLTGALKAAAKAANDPAFLKRRIDFMDGA